MKKITRTIITHSVVLAEVDNMKFEPFETVELPDSPKAHYLLRKAKERKKQVVVLSDTPIEHKYAMDVDTFMKHATLLDVNDGEQDVEPFGEDEEAE